MARANNNGWDFLKVGKSYQYSEDGLIAMVSILEDNSTEEKYKFKIRFDKANLNLNNTQEDKICDIENVKNDSGIYSGMVQFYEDEEYIVKYIWERKK